MYRPYETLQIAGRCVSVVGSGGKTTFLRHMSERLDGTVVLTTSTHILPFPGMPLVAVGTDAVSRERSLRDIQVALKHSRVVCVGRPLPSGKLTDPSSTVPFEDLLRVADAVLIEADGAKGRPLKAHRPWEPVVPACTDLTVCLVGASGLGGPASRVCHCPELFCGMAGSSPDEPVSESAVARVLNREDLADVYLVNQIDALADPERAIRLCGLIQKTACPCSLMPRGG